MWDKSCLCRKPGNMDFERVRSTYASVCCIQSTAFCSLDRTEIYLSHTQDYYEETKAVFRANKTNLLIRAFANNMHA